jgi:glutathione S-transferase
MRIRTTPISPFGRKCLVLAHEAGLRLEVVETTLGEPALTRDNPLGKVPVLLTDEGEAIFDSPVICAYLDALHDGPKLVPPSGMPRFRALRREALADGIADAVVLVRLETAVRPETLRWHEAVERQLGKVRAGLDALEAEAGGWGDVVDVGHIATACMLAYVDFRLPDLGWRATRPRLAAWSAAFAERPSMVATRAR